MAGTVSGSIRKVGMSAPRWNCPSVRSRPASRLPKTLPSGSSPETAPSKSVVSANARFFAGQKASPCPRRSFFSATERRFGRCGVFPRSKSVRLPEEKSFFGQNASVWPARSFFLAGKCPFARRKIFLSPESVVLPEKKSFSGWRASFCPKKSPGLLKERHFGPLFGACRPEARSLAAVAAFFAL